MNPPANWYPDPTGRHGQRYWDGQQWTEHVFSDGVQAVDPLAETAPEQEATSDVGQEVPEDAAPAEPEGQADATADPALFADAGGAQLTPPGVADPGLAAEVGAEPPTAGDDAGLWTPGGDGHEESSALAPDVEADDVVATIDEVTAPEDATPAGDEPIAGSDMSDAFVLAPETVSRLVSRRQATPEDEVDDDGDAPVGAIDAPPPVVGAPAADAPPPAVDAPPTVDAPPPGSGPGRVGLGIAGDLVGGAFAEREEAGPVALQNSRLLRCTLDGGTGVVARQGTMVAYQGDVSFDRQGAGGVARALKRAATGEGLAMMRVDGTGDVFFADGAQHVFLLHLDSSGAGLSVNGRNVLAFSASLQWDIERVKGATLLAGGLFNTTLTGNGWVALVSDGEPVVLRTDEAPTFVDVNALVAWSAGLSTRVVGSVNAKALVGLGSGEAFQMAFDGAGIVVVQPSEGVADAAAGS